jgi:hypothetical protein
MMRADSPVVPFTAAKQRRRLTASDAATSVNHEGDCSDPESQRVLSAAALAVARALGRQAAREYFAELLGTSKVP